METIATRFIGIRKKMGLTQIELADKLGISIGALQGYEYGKVPKGEVLILLSEWGYNLNWLFSGHETMRRPTIKPPSGIERKFVWNVAYHLCEFTEANDDPDAFAEVMVGLSEWAEENHKKPKDERASKEVTAEIFEFATKRLQKK